MPSCPADRFSDITNICLLPSAHGWKFQFPPDHHCIAIPFRDILKHAMRESSPFPHHTSRNLPRNGSVAENTARHRPRASDLCEFAQPVRRLGYSEKGGAASGAWD
jgi:hypothetical protein